MSSTVWIITIIGGSDYYKEPGMTVLSVAQKFVDLGIDESWTWKTIAEKLKLSQQPAVYEVYEYAIVYQPVVGKDGSIGQRPSAEKGRRSRFVERYYNEEMGMKMQVTRAGKCMMILCLVIRLNNKQ